MFIGCYNNLMTVYHSINNTHVTQGKLLTGLHSHQHSKMQEIKVKTCFAIREKILNTKVSCFLITEINTHLNSLPRTLTISNT